MNSISHPPRIASRWALALAFLFSSVLFQTNSYAQSKSQAVRDRQVEAQLLILSRNIDKILPNRSRIDFAANLMFRHLALGNALFRHRIFTQWIFSGFWLFLLSRSNRQGEERNKSSEGEFHTRASSLFRTPWQEIHSTVFEYLPSGRFFRKVLPLIPV